MKELSLNQMEMVSGGGWIDHFNNASGHQVYCLVAATANGFYVPPLGLVAGFLCLFPE